MRPRARWVLAGAIGGTSLALVVAACASLGQLRQDDGGDGGAQSMGDAKRDRAVVDRNEAHVPDASTPCIHDDASILDASDASPVVDCDGATIDLRLSSANCGRCGHDCLGATCNGGLCTAVDSLVEQSPLSVVYAATDGQDLYTLENTQNTGWIIRHVAVVGDAGPTTLGTSVLSQSGAYLNGMVVGEGAVFVSFESTGANGYIFKQPLDGGGLEQIFLPRGMPQGIALWSGSVAYTDAPDASVSTVSFGDGGSSTLVSSLGMSLGAIASSPDLTHLFWLELQSVNDWTLVAYGAGLPTLTSHLAQDSLLATDEQYIFVVESGTGRILRLSIDATRATPAPTVLWQDSTESGIAAMALDADYVYWFGYEADAGSSAYRLSKISKCGGSATIMLEAEPGPIPSALVASVGGRVYWVGASGALRSVAK